MPVVGVAVVVVVVVVLVVPLVDVVVVGGVVVLAAAAACVCVCWWSVALAQVRVLWLPVRWVLDDPGREPRRRSCFSVSGGHAGNACGCDAPVALSPALAAECRLFGARRRCAT